MVGRPRVSSRPSQVAISSSRLQITFHITVYNSTDLEGIRKKEQAQFSGQDDIVMMDTHPLYICQGSRMDSTKSDPEVSYRLGMIMCQHGFINVINETSTEAWW